MSLQVSGIMRASGPRIAKNATVSENQNRNFGTLPARQQRNTRVQVRAALDNTPGMVVMDPQSTGRTIKSTNSGAASTSAKSTPISYRVSLFGKILPVLRILYVTFWPF